jgi:hypothetical protein
MARNSLNVVVYVRAEDAKFLREKLLHTDPKTWVRQVVQANIDRLKERDERADA